MKKWHLIKKQPLLKEIFKEPPLISDKKGRSLKDILVRAKLWERLKHERGSRAGLSPPFYTFELKLVVSITVTSWFNYFASQ